ncbi:hypothetical protein DID88_004753 [Monilinia fructigena]|uniref:Endonuclease/exonuclease/phosphatase domain-containing protein n=1 Tax=Monilinia fructigena TaxID=38457 RepID=A0A395IRJ5_9HELO|nr:hypothetical protein DID88_004753 [Monilinia fructigena]
MLRNEAGRSGEDRATARANGLKIAWANVGKPGPAHIALLQLAFEEGADVVCVQEPSVYPGTKTQNHPAYECYAPVDSWEQTLLPEREAERPRAMSYTRKAANLATQQRRNGKDRDIVWLEVPSDFLIGGDFNAKHDMFEPGVESSNQGASLAAWSLDSGADFIGERVNPRIAPATPLTSPSQTFLPERGQGADSNTGFRVTEANLPRLRPPRNGRTATDTSMDNDHLAGGSGKGRDRRVKHLPWIGPRHRTTAKSLLAAYQSVHKKLLPEMLRAIAFPIRLEASGGGNASEGGKKGQVVGTLLETNRTIVMHWERSGAGWSPEGSPGRRYTME